MISNFDLALWALLADAIVVNHHFAGAFTFLPQSSVVRQKLETPLAQVRSLYHSITPATTITTSPGAAGNTTNATSPGAAGNTTNTTSPGAAGNTTNATSPGAAGNTTNATSPGAAGNATNTTSPGGAANATNATSPGAANSTNVTNSTAPRIDKEDITQGKVPNLNPVNVIPVKRSFMRLMTTVTIPSFC
ncbi:uncharacterized protein, partial [Cherax quadricarinatus]|uniref:uncharacterized protein n=1 Tax=Cherax quadricarinatus TaxID=27406 RepID=UPI00387E86CB